ncbi:MAG: FtsK/SpoIIIE domain-containing protein, partial [Paludibacter sp.]
MTINLGNYGMPWNAVDLLNEAKPYGFAVRFGVLIPKIADLQQLMPDLDWNVSMPAILPFVDGGTLFIAGFGDKRDTVITCLHSIALRTLTCVPLGTMRVIVLDPLGFSIGIYPWSYWPGSVYTDMNKIEAKVIEIFEKMEYIASVLLLEHKNLQAYNLWAKLHDELVEPYNLLILHDFPKGLSPNIIQKLQWIIKNSERCGFVTLIHWGEEIDKYAQTKFDDMAIDSIALEYYEEGLFRCKNDIYSDCLIQLDVLPSEGYTKKIVDPIVDFFVKANDKSLLYDELINKTNSEVLWKESSAKNIKTPIGLSEDGKLVWLEFGEGNGVHALVVGTSGSGKSNLINVVITGFAEKYSPEELQFYMVDLKGGVEFKKYIDNSLPQAKIVAIDCEREYGLSVLEALGEEMERRMNLFRTSKNNILNISEYRIHSGNLPRIILVMDEFHKLFDEEDEIASRSRNALDNILKDGRAFGIHALLGTQTLKGFSMRGGSLEQIAVRIVFRCSDDDSRMVLSVDNAAGKTLEKFHAIYNDKMGTVDGNTIFRATFLSPDNQVKNLGKILAMRKTNNVNIHVFEGNEKPIISSCEPFKKLYIDADEWPVYKAASQVWIGDPVSVKSPVEFGIDQQRGRNVIAVFQKEDEGMGLMFNIFITLLCQYKPGNANFIFFNFIKPNSEFYDFAKQISNLFDHQIDIVLPEKFSATVGVLGEDIKIRLTTPSKCKPTFLFLNGLQYARDLRENRNYNDSDDNSVLTQFLYILKEGSEHGVHSIIWCDMFANIERCGNAFLSEFGIIISGKMDRSDSSDFFGGIEADKLKDV